MLSKITKLAPLLEPFAATRCADIDIVANRLKCRYPDTFLVRNEEAIAPISRFLMLLIGDLVGVFGGPWSLVERVVGAIIVI
jgi:hypothetical protein